MSEPGCGTDAWDAVSEVDQRIGDIIDSIPSRPKRALSTAQLRTALAHMQAAARLLVEVEKREAPLYDERDYA